MKRKCCIRQIRLARVLPLLFHFQVSCYSTLSCANLGKCTTPIAYVLDDQVHNCCAELSSQAFVLFDPCDRWGRPTPFVQGHSVGSFRVGLPPGGDPFVYHGVTSTEYKHELALFFPFSFSVFYLVISFSGLSFFFSCTCADLKATDKTCFAPFFRIKWMN